VEIESKIFVAGHKGMVGSAIVRKLRWLGYNNILTVDRITCDLTDQSQVRNLFAHHRPEYVFLAAAKVGGIKDNNANPADFIYQNLMIQSNVIDCASWISKKLLFVGSACIYPKYAEVPIKEESLMTGELEPTNEAYAVAKIAGYTMAKAYTKQHGFSTVSAMPANLYGIGDNFNVNQAHVIPALISKFHNAVMCDLPAVTCFGDGTPVREFLYVDDLADALVFLMRNYGNPHIINIGSPEAFTIKEIATMIAERMGFTGKIVWDDRMPNGTPVRILDSTRMTSLGWKPKTKFVDGLTKTIEWFLEPYQDIRR
jgi:GDP-L-fucose synthase